MVIKQINDSISKCHKILAEWGDWDDMPHDWGIAAMDNPDGEDFGTIQAKRNRNSYLAGKVDKIASMAWKAWEKREGYKDAQILYYRAFDRIRANNDGYDLMAYCECVDGSYGDLLSRTMMLILDLMSVYGYRYVCFTEWLSFDSDRLYRALIGNLMDMATSMEDEEYVPSDSAFMHLLNILLTIAKYDNIGLGWHFDILMRVMENKMNKEQDMQDMVEKKCDNCTCKEAERADSLGSLYGTVNWDNIDVIMARASDQVGLIVNSLNKSSLIDNDTIFLEISTWDLDDFKNDGFEGTIGTEDESVSFFILPDDLDKDPNVVADRIIKENIEPLSKWNLLENAFRVGADEFDDDEKRDETEKALLDALLEKHGMPEKFLDKIKQ
jgi:hypothetical protein